MFSLRNVKYKEIIDIKELHINKHEITSIIGESGSGKTTLLRLLNKMISPDAGEIVYNNLILKEINAIDLRRSVVMLPQSPAIFKGSIKYNLLIGLKFSQLPLVSDERLYEVLKVVCLSKALTDDADKLSGGEKQRVALGRVLLLQPEVLLLDEPSSALDEDTEQLIIEALVNYTKENGKTLIMVTHSKKVAQHFSDQIIEIKKGLSFQQEVM